RSRAFSISRTRSAWVAAIGVTFSVVTPDSLSAAIRSATYPSGPTSEVPASSSAGTSAAASSFRPPRDAAWSLAASPPHPDRTPRSVVEVAPLARGGPQPADVQRQQRPGRARVPAPALADRQPRLRHHVQRRQRGIPAGPAGRQRPVPHLGGTLRE